MSVAMKVTSSITFHQTTGYAKPVRDGLVADRNIEFHQYALVFASNREHDQQKLIAEAYRPARRSRNADRLWNIVRELRLRLSRRWNGLLMCIDCKGTNVVFQML